MAIRISETIPLLVITLLCIGAVEGGYTAFEYFLRTPVGKDMSETVPAPDESATPPGEEQPHDYKIILSRNLFGQVPKAPLPAVPVADVAALELTDLGVVLVGTISGTGETPRAIILDLKTRKQVLYKGGEMIQGARIMGIHRGKVILSVNGKDELLDMSEAAKVRPTVSIREEIPPKESSAPAQGLDPTQNQNPEAQTVEGGVPQEMASPPVIPEAFTPSPATPPAPGKRNVSPRVVRPSKPPRSY